METRKPYLNPEITLESLANEISVNPRVLSQIINETLKKNFKSHILEYRIKESMQILADSKNRKLTVLEILYKVGVGTLTINEENENKFILNFNDTCSF